MEETETVEGFVFKCVEDVGGCGHVEPKTVERWPVRKCPRCPHAMRLVHADDHSPVTVGA